VGLRILKAGLLDTIQDRGRTNYQHLGVNPGGAMDLAAAAIANALAGNDETAAVIEIHFPACTILFEETMLIALSGADFSPVINDQPVSLNTPIIVSALSVLQFEKYQIGRCAYLAVNGGFNIKKWLGSYSTNLAVKAGGMNGRPLKKDDKISCLKNDLLSFSPKKDFIHLPWKADVGFLYADSELIRICEGPEFERLPTGSKKELCTDDYTITSQNNRMAFRMAGNRLLMINAEELISSAVLRGTIQLLPDGQLIILMADHQTTGGYPRIAQVIAADLHKLSQLTTNQKVKFEMVSFEDGEMLFMKQSHQLKMLKSASRLRLENYLHHEIH
jgi:antagonist of KipI